MEEPKTRWSLVSWLVGPPAVNSDVGMHVQLYLFGSRVDRSPHSDSSLCLTLPPLILKKPPPSNSELPIDQWEREAMESFQTKKIFENLLEGQEVSIDLDDFRLVEMNSKTYLKRIFRKEGKEELTRVYSCTLEDLESAYRSVLEVAEKGMTDLLMMRDGEHKSRSE